VQAKPMVPVHRKCLACGTVSHPRAIKLAKAGSHSAPAEGSASVVGFTSCVESSKRFSEP
jgi:hypothetical protein